MAVDVEDRHDAGVTEAGGDHRGVGALLDEEGDVAVAEVVKAHRLSHRGSDCGFPVPGAESGPS